MKRLTGFTLIELMIIVAIVGILASVILPIIEQINRNTQCAHEYGEGYLWEAVDDECFLKGKKVVILDNTKNKGFTVGEEPVNITAVNDRQEMLLWKEEVEGCTRAESRLRTYSYSGKSQLADYEKDDLRRLIDRCDNDKL